MTFYNFTVDKKSLKKLIAWAYTNYGSARCAMVADQLKSMGFKHATRAGVSISIEDLQVPPLKRQMLDSAEQEIRITEQRYSRGEITEVERFQKVIDTWNSTSEALKDEVVRNFRTTDPLNSVYMMAFSGARGNLSQVRQLVGMRGLMADPQGEIIDLPIKTNFREGLTVTEYIISSYGARKGLVDTALRTADSGYLTRRLVDVAQDVIVREIDCGTKRSVTVTPMTDGDRTLIPLGDRLLGRMLAEDVVDPKTGEVIAERNQDIDSDLAQRIGNAVPSVKVRSPLTCEAARSVCQTCYGWSLAHGKMVDMGEAVGIIAAQSIGEPGTQLTMRTFHTGGVFTGEVARQIRAPKAGTIQFGPGLSTRRVRTRHGDEREQVEGAGDLQLVLEKASAKPLSFPVGAGALLLVRDGDTVSADELLVEVASANQMRSTEKATKDVATDLAGEVVFTELASEEKVDRQGNMTRLASRGGLVWVLSGEVYNLPPGAEPVVTNNQTVEPGSILAETKLMTNSGGVVRLAPNSREIEIITASVSLDSAEVITESGGGREHYVINAANGQQFSLKATPGTKVQNQAIIAELLDERYQTPSGGIVKYAGIETAKGGRKQGYEVTQGGSLLWIAEETHEVNKDISLLLASDGEYVEAGTEVVKDIFTQAAGVIEVVQKNDILREIIIKPGQLLLITDEGEVAVSDGQFASPGTEVKPGVTVDELSYCEFLETTEGKAILLRPVQEFTIADDPAVPSQGSINEEGNRTIELRSVQRLHYKDGERVKSVNGVSLLSTQLILNIEDQDEQESVSHLTADIELKADTNKGGESCQRLQLVILESLVLRRDTDIDPHGGHIHTRILVENGQEIPPGAIVAQTETQCTVAGEVRGIREGVEAIRRILIVRDVDRVTVAYEGKAQVKVGDYVVAGSLFSDATIAAESGQVLDIQDQAMVLRIARPYRVSTGAILHIDDGDLVQRGDNLVLLVFERPKTGDIIQGLPRIEELLEARKPKEACILSRRPGTCQVEYWEDETVDVKIIEADGVTSDYPVNPGQNVIVTDGQKVEAAQPLTDGLANPHEILEIFFNLHVEELGIYEAALIGLQKAQSFLVMQVQSVYQSQGIDISDKHIEVIVRQMTSKVRVDDGGDTTMLPGELVELRQIEQVNEAMSITGGAPAQYTPVLLGITKASLNTDSFISAASFQETTRVLTEAAIEGKSDWLRGLKENVIIGRLIPAGTGFNAHEDLRNLEGTEETRDSFTPHPGILYDRMANPGLGNGEESNSPRSAYEVLRDTAEDVVLDDQTARAYTNGESLSSALGDVEQESDGVADNEDESSDE